jgi:hypothetical protein
MRLTLPVTFRDIDPGPVTARSETAHTTPSNCGDGRDRGGAQDHRDSVTGKHIRVEVTVGAKSRRCDARKNSSLPRPSRAVQAAHKSACAWAARGEPKARRGRVAGPDVLGGKDPGRQMYALPCPRSSPEGGGARPGAGIRGAALGLDARPLSRLLHLGTRLRPASTGNASSRGTNKEGRVMISDLRGHCAIVQPRLYDSAVATQITLKTESPHGLLSGRRLAKVDPPWSWPYHPSRLRCGDAYHLREVNRARTQRLVREASGVCR